MNVIIKHLKASAHRQERNGKKGERPWSKQGLRELYIEDKLSQLEIAEKFQSSRSTVGRSLKEFGLNRAVAGNCRLPTKPERMLIQIIADFELPYKYVGDDSFRIGSMNPDFISLNGRKRVIEVFGNYWHDPSIRKVDWKNQEFGRMACLAQRGYMCLVLWEREMYKKSGEEIAESITSFDQKSIRLS